MPYNKVYDIQTKSRLVNDTALPGHFNVTAVEEWKYYFDF